MSNWIQLLILTAFINTGCSAITISLTPPEPVVSLNGGVTFVCKTGPPSPVLWDYKDKTRHLEQLLYIDKNGTCMRQGQNNFDVQKFSFSCEDNETWIFAIMNVEDNQHQATIACSTLGINRTVTLAVQVPVMNTTINPFFGTLTTAENSTLSWQCTTSKCRPAPRIIWYKQSSEQSDMVEISNFSANGSSTASLESYSHNYSIKLDRAWNGYYLLCSAQNNNGGSVFSRKILLNVTYPPDGPPSIATLETGSTINVTKNIRVLLVCSVTGGNPIPKLDWNVNNDIPQTVSGIRVFKNLSWQATDNNKRELSCQSTHQLKNDTSYVIANVLFPPVITNVTLSMYSGNLSNIQKDFSVIENTSLTMSLICSALSNPSPNSYRWTGLKQIDSECLELNISRDVGGIYTCNVNNTMTTYQGLVENGYISVPYAIKILQLPSIRGFENAKIVEGNELSIPCPIISGNETWRSVKWLNHQNVPVGQNGNLYIKNVSRLDNGRYECQLDFIMQPTYGLQKNDTVTKGFYLDVLYKAEISRFSMNNESNILTVNETARVLFACNVESNPNSTVEIEFHDSILSKEMNTRTLNVLIPSINCNDTGNYVCSANNMINSGHPARLKNTLFVNCSPRPSPSVELKTNVTSALNETAIFRFTTMAYPHPRFQWYRILNGSEISEEHGGVIITETVSTNEMQTNFTLNDLEETHYGEYLLKIENQYGTFYQTFYLIFEGKPNPPTFYGFYADSITSDSVTIWWEPGFDGGLPQSFIISYNLTVTKWYNETAIGDNKERRMNKTISELASGSKYQVLIYAKNEKGDVRIPGAIIINTTAIELPMNEVTKPTNFAAVVGGTMGGVLAVLTVAVVAVVIIVRKRSFGKQDNARGEYCDFKDTHTYTNFSKEMNINTTNADDKALFLETKQTSLDSPKLPERMPLKLAAKHNLQELDDYDEKAEERIYDNTYEKIKRIERINVSELFPYLTNKPTDFFGSEFTKLPTGLTKPYNFSQNPENIALNRYHGIYPYDHSRVKIADEPSFFINACYIDGYKKKKAFIASLGPLSKTTFNFVTFWKMVWSEKSDTIVMLTKLTEPSGVKCDPYWPKPETTQIYGDVSVASVNEDVYSDYVLRTFTLSMGNETRKLMQFHFMAWPDKSIPEDVTCLLEFRKRVNASHASGPIIVHCSAGIGRTGTLIAIEILIEEGRRKGSVNVVECVKTMRDQRTSMVQTVDQYHYIYKALVNALVFDCEAVTSRKFQKYVDKTSTEQFNKMFQTFNQTVEADSTSESNARTANKTYRNKNRIGSDIPGDSHRVRLFLNRDEETSMDYINAVYIDSFTKKDHFVVAQSPMTNGVEDFLCMLYQVECICIVSLGDTQQGRNVGMYIPADNTQSLSIGSFNVTCKTLDAKDNYVVRKMKIEFKGKYDGGEKEVYHFEYTDWELGQKTPSDPISFFQFTSEVEDFASQLGSGKSQVLVHCLNAYERSCLFCAVVTLVEKVKYEGEVCVSNTLRHVRARRRLAIPNMEQFQFCFRAVCAYINMDTTGSSIEEKAYINMALA